MGSLIIGERSKQLSWMASIFISYAREDRDWARRLASRFELEGWSVWWDSQIPSGAEFHDAVFEELKTA